MIFAMFPGQGSQYVGMGRDLLAHFSQAGLTFEEAEDAIGKNIRKLVLEGPKSELLLTINTQPAILTLSVAMYRVLQEELGFCPSLVAGHSLGEYSALVAGGKLAFADGVRLVRKRGELMQEAVPRGVGAMLAVLNVTEQDLGDLCSQVSHEGDLVTIANVNSPKQLVVAGHQSAVDRLQAILEERKTRAVPLPVSAPFHSPLMLPAKEKMEPFLKNVVLEEKGGIPVIANLTGKVEEIYTAALLIDQIDAPVLWAQSLKAAQSLGMTLFVEVGPGKVLLGLARQSVKDVKIMATDNILTAIRSLESLVS